MGGYGSGPQRPSQFQLAEHCAVLKIERVAREARRAGTGHWARIAIGPTLYGQKRPREVAVTWTPCRYGGMRCWFRCPACDRRCTRLFLPLFLTRYACRQCHNLRYRSQRLSMPARWDHRADKIVATLGGEADDGLVYKPRGMHWRTFHRLMDRVQELHDGSIAYSLSRCAWLSRLCGGAV